MKWVGEHYSSFYGGKVNNPMLGEVIIDERAAKTSVSHGMSSVKGQAFYVVPDIIKSGKIIHVEHRYQGKDLDGYMLAAPVEIGGKSYIGIAVVRKDINMQRFYLHEAILKEKLQGLSKTGALQSEELAGASPVGAIRNILNRIFSVNIEEGAEDPDIAFSLSAPEVFQKFRARLQGEPKENLQIVFGENAERDLREFNDSFRISAWLGKTNKTVKALFDRQNRRDKDRSKLYHDFLSETKDVFDLDRDQMKEFSDLAFGLENKKVVDEPRFVKTGEREISKGTRGEIVTIPVYELNDKHYEELGQYLEKKKVSKPVRDAYVATRRTLDKSLTMIWDRLAEIKNIDPTLIEEFRTQIGSIENYFPHNRYGNFHIRAVDADSEEGENTRYRMHFNAMNEAHAKWWANRNIDRIREEAKKEHPDLDWDAFQWVVDRNRQLPEEVYDFPIPVDAMQKIIESAADRMPEDMREGLKKTLSEEVSNVLKSRGFGSHMIKRKDVPGFEKTDVARVLHDHFAGFSGWLTKMEAAHDFGEMLRGIDAMNKPNEYKWGTRFVQDMLQNQTRLDRVVDGTRTFFFLKYLGANVKTAAVNLTQNIVSGVPRLAMDTGFANAGKAFARATTDLRLALTEEGIKGAREGRLSDTEKRFLLDMFSEGWGQAQLTREMRGKVSGRFRQVKDKAIRVMGFPMEIAERYNRMSLGLAAFREATEGRVTNEKALGELKAKPGDKLSYDAAKKFAEGVVNDAHFIYGKGNRPAFLRGTAGGKMLSSAYTFRSFSHNLLSMWRWMLTQGDREGKKAFAYSIASMVALGGLGAVPLYGTLAALIRQLFGDDVLESGVRKELPPGMRDLVMCG